MDMSERVVIPLSEAVSTNVDRIGGIIDKVLMKGKRKHYA